MPTQMSAVAAGMLEMSRTDIFDLQEREGGSLRAATDQKGSVLRYVLGVFARLRLTLMMALPPGSFGAR
jgi:hypothetical protein